MAETLPLVGGLVLGVLASRLGTGAWRGLALGALGALVVLTAGLVSGELARSPAFLLVDGLEVLATAAVGALTARLGRERGQRRL
ncbi:MAG: hypothetical protein ACJ76V_12180 [Thermoleophilaceae bacterium]